MIKAVAIFSGGMDSTVMVYDMLSKGVKPHLLSFNYGQRHKKELNFARATAERLDLDHNIVDLTGLTELISNSALTTPKWSNGKGLMPAREIEVPDGHYAEETMRATVVPNRNMIMLSIAAGVCVSNGYVNVWTGVHSGDHFIYPDCRLGFIRQTAAAIELGNDGFHDFGGPWESIKAPYIKMTKADIAFRGMELGVPFETTWSCYKGGDIHCGKCGTCVERLEAIDEAHGRHDADRDFVYDKTEYADKEFWKSAVASAKS